jgi:hypothetical protein
MEKTSGFRIKCGMTEKGRDYSNEATVMSFPLAGNLSEKPEGLRTDPRQCEEKSRNDKRR